MLLGHCDEDVVRTIKDTAEEPIALEHQRSWS